MEILQFEHFLTVGATIIHFCCLKLAEICHIAGNDNLDDYDGEVKHRHNDDDGDNKYCGKAEEPPEVTTTCQPLSTVTISVINIFTTIMPANS